MDLEALGAESVAEATAGERLALDLLEGDRRAIEHRVGHADPAQARLHPLPELDRVGEQRVDAGRWDAQQHDVAATDLDGVLHVVHREVRGLGAVRATAIAERDHRVVHDEDHLARMDARAGNGGGVGHALRASSVATSPKAARNPRAISSRWSSVNVSGG